VIPIGRPASAPFVADDEVVEAPPAPAAPPPALAPPAEAAIPELEPEAFAADADEPFAPLASVPAATAGPTVHAPAAAGLVSVPWPT